MTKAEISAYKNYLTKPRLLYIDSDGGEVIYIPFTTDLPTLDSFIDKVLTDDEFDQEWGDGCTRKLSFEERNELYLKSDFAKDIYPTDEKGWNDLFDGYNIPKRAIIS
jgi:hypothetical protein